MKFVRISAIWCSSCIITYNTWLELKKIYPDAEFLEYDYDLDDEVKNYNVGSILPVIIVYHNNEEKVRIIGEKRKEEILIKLNEVGIG